MRRPPDARLHAQGGIAPAQEADRPHTLAGVSHQDAATAQAMYHVACDMLRDCCPKAAVVAEEAEPDALAYLRFPPSHWKCLRTNNVQERANREINRRSRVVQVFPSEESLEPWSGP